MILIIKNELKKAFKLRYIIAFILIALILQGFLQVGKLIHLENAENKNSLQESERSRVKTYTMFRQYASFGITLFFVPSPFGILYNDSTYELLVSNSNIGDTFNIYLPKNAEQLFSINSPFMTFMGISLLLFFFFGILYGIETTNNKDYLRYLSSLSGTKKVLRFIFFFRIILLNAALLLMVVINISVLLKNKINLFRLPLLTFLLGLFLVITLAFVIGCFLGTIQSNLKRNIAFFVIYFLSVILLILLLNFITKLNSGDIKPVFEFNNDNLKAVMTEEENMKKKHGILPLNKKPTEEEIIDARESLFRYNKKIRENLDGLKHKLENKIKTRKFIASLFPTLFYFSLCEDASTNGYDSYIDFFTFSEDKKEKFVQFSVDRIYPFPEDEPDKKSNQDSKESQGKQGDKGDQNKLPKVESFIKDDEDLFFAKSKLPRYFWLGSIISILWIAGFLLPAYRRTFRQLKGKPGKISNFEVKMNSDDLNYLATADQGLKNQVNNYLSRDEFEGFIYAYEALKFVKDIDLKILYTELLERKYTEGIGVLKSWKILVQAAEKTDSVLVLDNFFKGLNISEVKEIIQYIKHRGIKALYIGENLYEAEKIADNLIFSVEDRSVEGIREIIDEVNSHR
jgi:hypothetical protein